MSPRTRCPSSTPWDSSDCRSRSRPRTFRCCTRWCRCTRGRPLLRSRTGSWFAAMAGCIGFQSSSRKDSWRSYSCRRPRPSIARSGKPGSRCRSDRRCQRLRSSRRSWRASRTARCDSSQHSWKGRRCRHRRSSRCTPRSRTSVRWGSWWRCKWCCPSGCKSPAGKSGSEHTASKPLRFVHKRCHCLPADRCRWRRSSRYSWRRCSGAWQGCRKERAPRENQR